MLSLILAAASAGAQIYKWRLPDGSIEYSDRSPAEGAEKVELSPLVTYSPPAATAPGAASETEGPAEFNGYKSFAIASPADGAEIRGNAGEITVNFAVTPSLFEGHAIDVFMDGRKFGRSTAAVVTLSEVDRGSHQIYATLVDETGAELARTGTITVHLQRVSNILPDPDVQAPRAPRPSFPAGAESPGGAKSPGGPKSPGGAG